MFLNDPSALKAVKSTQGKEGVHLNANKIDRFPAYTLHRVF
jgi:hypothetical protein